METLRDKKVIEYAMITKYIIRHYSELDLRHNCSMLESAFVNDIAKLNYIIGRMDGYISGKKDYENFDLMDEWFMKEMTDRCYSMKDFLQFIENENSENENSENNG